MAYMTPDVLRPLSFIRVANGLSKSPLLSTSGPVPPVVSISSGQPLVYKCWTFNSVDVKAIGRAKELEWEIRHVRGSDRFTCISSVSGPIATPAMTDLALELDPLGNRLGEAAVCHPWEALEGGRDQPESTSAYKI